MNECLNDYKKRLNEIIDFSWYIFKRQFLDGRFVITTEAPFQHYFANIISSVGNLYCTQRTDIFCVNLETREENIRGKRKFIDITCEFPEQKIKSAIELKFKTKAQAAQDYGRIDAFIDIEALEHACTNGYDFGTFFMITDSTTYIKQSKKGVGVEFAMHHNAQTKLTEYCCPECKGRQNVKVLLKHKYKFNWEDSNSKEWHFLKLDIKK